MRRSCLLLALVLAVACGGADEPPDAATKIESTVESFDGLPIRYLSRGEGPIALVFIHGWCCDKSHWAAQTGFFAADHRVVALDLPGHGASGMGRPGWPLSAFGRDVRTVVDKLGLERVVLVGHSMGGIVALETARLIPERVLGVVGVDTLHNAEAELDPREAEEILARFEADFPGTCDGFVRQVLFHEDADDELVDRIAAGMCDAPRDVALTLWRQFLDYDAPGALSALPVPLRCINGTIAPTSVEVNRRYARDYDALIMDGVGHFPMLERPDEFNRLLADVVEELTGA